MNASNSLFQISNHKYNSSGLVMSSIGEVSLLYINRAHVLIGSVVTRRMMLVYMASTALSMIIIPVFLRFIVSHNNHLGMKSGVAARGRKHEQAVMEMTAVSSDVISRKIEGVHAGESRRRKKDHTIDDVVHTLPV